VHPAESGRLSLARRLPVACQPPSRGARGFHSRGALQRPPERQEPTVAHPVHPSRMEHPGADARCQIPLRHAGGRRTDAL